MAYCAPEAERPATEPGRTNDEGDDGGHRLLSTRRCVPDATPSLPSAWKRLILMRVVCSKYESQLTHFSGARSPKLREGTALVPVLTVGRGSRAHPSLAVNTDGHRSLERPSLGPARFAILPRSVRQARRTFSLPRWRRSSESSRATAIRSSG